MTITRYSVLIIRNETECFYIQQLVRRFTGELHRKTNFNQLNADYFSNDVVDDENGYVSQIA